MAIQAPVELGTLDDASAATHVFTIPAGGVPKGALLVIRAIQSTGAITGISTVADTKGNVYAVDITARDASTECAMIVTSVLATALVAGDTVTITPLSTATLGAAFAYFTASYGWLASPLDKTAQSSPVSGGTWTSTATATTTRNEELLIGACIGNPSTSSSTPTGGFTGEQDLAIANLSRRLVCEYQIVAATGAYAATGNWAPNASSTAAVATYKTAPAPTTEANLYLYHGEP